jgi:hypothetical protein
MVVAPEFAKKKLQSQSTTKYNKNEVISHRMPGLFKNCVIFKSPLSRFEKSLVYAFYLCLNKKMWT